MWTQRKVRVLRNQVANTGYDMVSLRKDDIIELKVTDLAILRSLVTLKVIELMPSDTKLVKAKVAKPKEEKAVETNEEKVAEAEEEKVAEAETAKGPEKPWAVMKKGTAKPIALYVYEKSAQKFITERKDKKTLTVKKLA